MQFISNLFLKHSKNRYFVSFWFALLLNHVKENKLTSRKAMLFRNVPFWSILLKSTPTDLSLPFPSSPLLPNPPSPIYSIPLIALCAPVHKILLPFTSSTTLPPAEHYFPQQLIRSSTLSQKASNPLDLNGQEWTKPDGKEPNRWTNQIWIPIKHTFSLKKFDITTYAEVDHC